MDMIKSLKIGPIPYIVKEESKLVGPNGDGHTTWLNGRVRYERALIEVDADLPDDVKRVCLLHEALHAIAEQAGITDEPEPLIAALGYGLLKLLRENPALVEYLVSTQPPVMGTQE